MADGDFRKAAALRKAKAQITKPDWDTWRHIPKAPLWTAVALSCDMDADAIIKQWGVIRGQYKHGMDIPAKEDLYSEEMNRRLKIAIAHDWEFLSTAGPGPAAWTIRLADFGRWARNIGLTLPDGFHVDVDQVEPAGKDDEKPMHPRERDSLLILIGALLDHAGINPEERGAPARVSSITESSGIPLSADTVSRFLREIPKARANREK